MKIIAELFWLLRDGVVALSDAAFNRSRRRYEHWVRVQAPREIVWEMIRSPDITFEGLIPIRLVGAPVPGRPNLERVRIRIGRQELILNMRVVEERPGFALLFEVLPDGTDPALIDGRDDYLAYVLTEIDAKTTQLGVTREMTVTSRLGRMTVPYGLRAGSQRYKRKAEQMACQGLVREAPHS